MNNTISEAFKVLKAIEVVSGTNEKQSILSDYQDNLALQYLLKATYSPFTQYYIKKIPEIDTYTTTNTNEDTFLEFTMLLNKLSTRTITGNLAKDTIIEFLMGCNSEEQYWYTRVIQRDLRIGMATTGINKVIKGLIPTYEVLLADKIKPEDLNLDTPGALKILPKRVVTQYKIDGYRLNIHVHNDGNVELRTRNGKIVTGYNELENEASEKLPRGYVYDGEIVAPELFEWIQNNTKSHSDEIIANRDLFSEVMSHAFSKEDNKKGVFNLFDMVPMTEWYSKKTTETLLERYDRIQKEVAVLDLKTIVIVPTSRVYDTTKENDRKEIVDTFHQFLSIGWEGLMIKNAESVYEFKRSKNLLKMKLMDTVDLEVKEILEGTGKYTGMMGSVVVDYKGYDLNVGSGWDDSQRQYYWNHKNELLGKTIEISYQAETTNKNGEKSVSFPVVKTIRQDK